MRAAGFICYYVNIFMSWQVGYQQKAPASSHETQLEVEIISTVYQLYDAENVTWHLCALFPDLRNKAINSTYFI